ncbi:ATP-dependent helicase [Patescibacteria group bacterium]|nr:ATP-dependent helicase [Patescibacteria group bacterium]
MTTQTQLNQQQKQAVEHTTGPLLIVAGAGTGKTTVITEKIAYLMSEKKLKSDQILALTFTDKAAGEMEERVDKLLPYGYTDLWIMTFHAFCERILKQHGLDIGIPNDFKLLNQTEQWMITRQNLDKFNLDYYRPLGNPTKFIHALINHFSRCKDEEIWPQDYLEYAEKLKINLDNMEATGGEDATSEIKRLEEIANAYHIYQQLLLDNSSLDFGDLINYTLKLFQERPNILKKYQYQFKYILVDEFQDTNWAQYELVKLLVGTGFKPVQNLTVVGDDDQSVYKFRGASVSNILQFKDDFPKSKKIYLNQNYRSSQNILDLAYNFIQLNNPERLEVKLQGANKLSKKLKSNSKDDGIIEHLHFATESEEVDGVINKILELYKNNWNDFAILVRANNQAEAFLNGLRNADIPFNFVASKGLYSKEIIMDVLAYLKLLDNYHESLAMWRVLNFPMINIEVEDLMEISRFSQRKTLSLFEACQQIPITRDLKKIKPETARKINKILNFISTHTKLAREKNTKAVVLKFLQDFEYSQWLLNKNDEKSFVYINLFIKKIDEFEKSFDNKSIKNFMRLTELELESGEQGSLSKELEEGPEAVKVMTIHSAKGLEFKYVFIVNLVDKRFPSINRSDPIQLPDELVKEIIPTGDIHLQEERRLFYVAMTRAKTGLFFTSADDYGGSRKKKLSRFIYEIKLESSASVPQKSFNTSADKLQLKTNNLPAGATKGGKIAQAGQHFSYSQLKAYETCPYQYYLSFILKIPVIGKAVFSYGKTMHSVLQKFFLLIKGSGDNLQGDLFTKNIKTSASAKAMADRQKHKNTLPSIEELLEIYQESWIDDWYESKEQKEKYKKQGRESLKKLYNQIKSDPPQVLELEKGFNFKIKNYTIKGVIDRVDNLGNKVEIIDYKTGTAKDIKKIEKDQLLIYQMAGQETFGWDIKKLTFYYLDNNTKVSFLGTEKEIETQKNKILDLIEQIKKADFEATPSKYKCQYCDFNSICRFQQ